MTTEGCSAYFVSAFPRPREQSNRFGDNDTQSRFSALRGFDILTHQASAANGNCNDPNQGDTNAAPFPSDVPRSLAPQLNFQSFDLRDTQATHVQLRMNTNQCTGAPACQGEQDADPTNSTDCDQNSAQGEIVRAAELEVFSR